MLVFWRYGYDATSVSQLTEAMGIGPPSMYAAFGDKRRLFEEAINHYMKNYGAFMARSFQEPNVYDAVARMLLQAADMFTHSDHPPGCMLITATTNCSPESAPVQERLRSIRAYTARTLEGKFAEAIASGQLPTHADARALALFFSATLQGMSAQARDGASRAELRAVARTALRAWPRSRVRR